MRKETCLRIIVFFCAEDFWFRMYIINQRNTTLTYLALNKVHSWCLSIDEVFLKHARTWESTNATPELITQFFFLYWKCWVRVCKLLSFFVPELYRSGLI